MDIKRYEYAVMERNELLLEASRGQQQRTALLGQIVKVDGAEDGMTALVRFLKDGDKWESCGFLCPMGSLVSIEEWCWPFFAAVTSPQERVRLAKNKPRLQKLKHVTTDMVVGFNDDDVHIGIVRYIGQVKGIGQCYGIKLHEKREGNLCDGSCAGIQYFSCFKGCGVFTSIDKIIPDMSSMTNGTTKRNDIDQMLQKNLVSLTVHVKKFEDKENGLKSNYFKSATNQNVLAENTVNTNNDFDQNSIVQPEHTYLIDKNGQGMKKTKVEVDLSDLIGNSWLGADAKYNVYNTMRKETGMRDAREGNNKTRNTFLTGDDDLGKNPTGVSKEIYRAKDFGSQDICTSAPDKEISPKESYNLETYNQKAIYNPEIYNSKDGYNFKENYGIKEPLIHNTFNGVGTIEKKPSKQKNFNYAVKTIPKKLKGQDELPVKSYSNSKFYLNDSELIARTNGSNCVPSTSQQYRNFTEPTPGESHDLAIGSLVEVYGHSDEPLYGVVRWLGKESNEVLIGVELEEDHPSLELNDGVYEGRRYFECNGDRALFVPVGQCHKDSRFQDGIPTPVHSITEKSFGMECPIIPGAIPPLIMKTEQDVDAVCGKFRGIQGHHNSCYLDATLFAMFTYTAVFDSLLFRPKGPQDIADYEEVQRVLREEIVNPLRKNLFVRADRVMNLRKLLDQLSSVSGLTSEEKDPEEFLNSLLAQILKAEPYLKLNSGQEAYYYQLFVEKDNELNLPTVQYLFEQSFHTSDIKLKEVPSCLIVQMPRFGKNYKMYPRILPSSLLDVTDVIENSPRQCTVCGKLAKIECRDCFGASGTGSGLESTAYCSECFALTHNAQSRRAHHKPKKLLIPNDFMILADHCPPPRLFMELFAVVCIETSHYVAFVKCGVGHEAPWCFFDSMADRKGERNGYNIPEMVACPDVSKWLSYEHRCRELDENAPLDRHLPEHARRLLCDAYICMYQSSDVMMYR